MQVVLYPDVFQAVVTGKFDDLSHKRIIDSLLNSQSSEIVYSKRMLELLRQELSDDDALSYQALVTKLSDEGKNLKSSDSSVNIIDEINHLNNSSLGNIVLNIAYRDKPELAIVNEVAVISKQIKPNYHWLICNLAVLSPNKVTVNCYDFSNDAEVEMFFNQIFSLSKKITSINIFDTQCNLNHKNFNCIIGKTQINYFTKRGSNRGYSDEDNFQEIKSKFTSNFKMFTVAARRAHARRIIIDDIVITCDNDYWNLIVDGQDWSIDVQISKSDALSWLKRTSLYTQFLSRIRR